MKDLRLPSGCLLLCLLTVSALTTPSAAQTIAGNLWTWVGGSSQANLPAVYGTKQVPAIGNTPGARGGAASWTDAKGNLWIFGGGSAPAGDLSSGYSSDLWELNVTTQEWSWMAGPDQFGQAGVYGTLGTPAPSNNPVGRGGAVTWTDLQGNLWLFGGEAYNPATNTGAHLNDLWRFSPDSNDWTWMGGTDVMPTCQSAYNSCGPQGVYGTLGVASPTNVPGGRSGAMGWVDSSGNLWLFGGVIYGTSLNGGNGVENDLWMFNPKTNEWTWMGGSSSPPESCTVNMNSDCGQPGVYGQQRSPSTANIPGAREYSMTWTDKAGNLWLFGGLGFDSQGTRGDLNDLWEFTPSSNQWVWVTGSNTVGSSYGGQPGLYGTFQTPASSNTPGGRDTCTGWKDAQGNLWLFGGGGFDENDKGGTLNDLWAFSPSTLEWAWMSGSAMVAPSGSYGTLGVPSPVNLPPARAGASPWSDSAGNLWMFGGSGLDDVWEYQTSSSGSALADAPTFTPTGGSYSSVQSVSISDGTAGATIYYMIDGSAPLVPYSGPITVKSSETIQAIASASGYASSAAATAVYTLNLPPPPAPTFTPPPGSYYGNQLITITDAGNYSKIYYTTDGTTPTVNSTVYSGSFWVTSSETVQAIAVAGGGASSTASSGTYTILPVPPNTWAPSVPTSMRQVPLNNYCRAGKEISP